MSGVANLQGMLMQSNVVCETQYTILVKTLNVAVEVIFQLF